MQNRPFNTNPAFLAAAVANLVNPALTSAAGGVGINSAAGAAGAHTQPVAILKHIHIANVTGTAATFTIYLGATGGSTAGTELWKGVSVAANSYFDWYGALRMDSTQFLTGLSGTASALTFQAEGEIGFS